MAARFPAMTTSRSEPFACEPDESAGLAELVIHVGDAVETPLGRAVVRNIVSGGPSRVTAYIISLDVDRERGEDYDRVWRAVRPDEIRKAVT